MNVSSRIPAALATAILALTLPPVAGAAQIVDRNVASPQLQVNGAGVALVTYSVHGGQRHVLYWGATDWSAQFKRDYSGGSEHKVANYRSFANDCRPYTGPRVALMVVACDASDGSHWALQKWSRLWPNYGGDQAPAELYISHWRGDVGALQIQTDYSHRGKNQHLWGGFTFHGKPVFGTSSTRRGVPADSLGRNIYVDYLTGRAWRRVNSFLTHPPTAGFCYTFASHRAASPAWNGTGTGDAYRATAIGPGVTPVVQTHFAPPAPYSIVSDDTANAQQHALPGSDSRCRID